MAKPRIRDDLFKRQPHSGVEENLARWYYYAEWDMKIQTALALFEQVALPLLDEATTAEFQAFLSKKALYKPMCFFRFDGC